MNKRYVTVKMFSNFGGLVLVSTVLNKISMPNLIHLQDTVCQYE